jgi:acyl-CoA thioesterase FadM
MHVPLHRFVSEVAFADTDASGWMHFPNIFRYVEAAREKQKRTEDGEQHRALADLLAAYERLRQEMESKPGS